MSDLRQTPLWAKYIKSLGWEVDFLEGTYCYSRKVPLLGYLTKIQRPLEILPKEILKSLLKKRRTFQLLIEPSTTSQFDYYKNLGFKIAGFTPLPTKTIRIKVSDQNETLLSRMHHKTRYNIKLSQRRGVIIKYTQDIDLFSNHWHVCAKKRWFFLSMKKEIKALYSAFEESSQILFAKFKDEILAGIFLVNTKDTTYYMYAFSNGLGKKLFAPSFLVWQVIIDDKKNAKKFFDFDGIYDERAPFKSWKGFSRFKKSFGGDSIEYPLPLSMFFPRGKL